MALHPVIQKMLDGARAAGRPALSAGSPDQARAMVSAMRSALGSGPLQVAVQEVQIATGERGLPARLYWPSPAPAGLVVYLHGGGWVCGGLEDFDLLARFLAHGSGCAVVMPDYRLAPEHPFPAGLNDAEHTLRWAQVEGLSRIGSRLPLVVSGDSAGANLGIAAVLGTREQVRVAFQAWFYPVTDSDFDRDSYLAHSEGMPLTREDMRWFFGHYAPQARWSDPRISVLRSPALGTSPPTWVATAEYDVLRDEGEAYAARLREAGVEVELRRVAGLPHGFARLFNHVDTARAAVEHGSKAIAAACAAAAPTSST